jgi:hypothetical protein
MLNERRGLLHGHQRGFFLATREDFYMATDRGGIKHLPVLLALTALQSGRLEAARTYAEASVELAQRDDAKESTEWIKGTRC